MWSVWWVWVGAGLALAILEVFAPAFVFVGFAIGAVVVGGLLALGLGITLPWLLVTFAVVSLLAWIVLRQVFGIRRGQVKTWDTDINEN